MKKPLRNILVIFLIIFLLCGVAIMLYPRIAAWYTQKHLSTVEAEYEDALGRADNTALENALQAARDYNQKMAAGEIDPLMPDENGYWDLLDLTGTGIIGYISIPKIDVYLPIYHGTDMAILSVGAGHVANSSLPVGGRNTHAVISAHSGMASSPMFTDLTLMEIGDQFQVIVLGQALTYEVDQILTVLPVEVGETQIMREQDLITLITCVPYGINTHRLLVRGHRIETVAAEEDNALSTNSVSSDDTSKPKSVWKTEYWHSITLGLGIVLGTVGITLVVLLLVKKKKRKEEAENDKSKEKS